MTTNTTTAGKTAKVIATLFVACGLIFSSCKKDPGPKGDTGPTGPQGAPGNANVYNYKFNVNLSSFIGPLTNGEWSSSNALTFMGSTFIDEKDAVLLYLFDKTVGSTDYYNALPFNDYFNTGTAFNQHSFQIGSSGSANILILKIRNSTGGQPYTSMTTGALSYKLVLVKASARMANPNVNYNDYNAVKEAFNLKD